MPGHPAMKHLRNIPALIASLLLIGVLALGIEGHMDRKAHTMVQQSFERALVTFAAVRGINAIISVVQGTEVAMEPGGVGVILTPGEVFDPMNDLIERFSWIMLGSVTSLGIQRIWLEAQSVWLMHAVLTLATGLGLVLIWAGNRLPPRHRQWLQSVFVLMLFLRLAVPMMAYANQWTYDALLATRYDHAFGALEQTRQAVAQANEYTAELPEDNDDPTLLQRLSRWMADTGQQFNVDARIRLYRERLARASEHVVELIIVFVLQTIVFPLLFLWLGYRILNAAATLPTSMPRPAG